MSEDKLKAATDQVAALKAEKEALKAEIAALKAVNNAESTTEKKLPKLTDKQREFTASWEEPDPKDQSKTIKKSGKAKLLDVPKITISGRSYTQEEFMSDKEAQSKALRMKHLLIEELK